MKLSLPAASFLETASTKGLPTRAPIERMVRVYSALKERRMVNCTTMARDLEVSVRSISRDIEFMRDRLQLPIEYDQVRHSYVYAGGAR